MACKRVLGEGSRETSGERIPTSPLNVFMFFIGWYSPYFTGLQELLVGGGDLGIKSKSRADVSQESTDVVKYVVAVRVILL